MRKDWYILSGLCVGCTYDWSGLNYDSYANKQDKNTLRHSQQS